MKTSGISDTLQRNYDDYYEDGDSTWRAIGAKKKVHNIIGLCKKYPHRSILEIGAGEGSILKRLDEESFGEELYALEISSSGVEVIRNKGISRLKECLLYDGYNTPYPDKRFDLVILSHVIEHVEFPRQLLYEASRVGEYIFVEVPLEDNIRLETDYVFNKLGHINYYSPKTFRRLLQTCNLKILSQTVTSQPKDAMVYQFGVKGLFKYYIKELLLKVFPVIATEIFTYHSSIICTSKQ